MPSSNLNTSNPNSKTYVVVKHCAVLVAKLELSHWKFLIPQLECPALVFLSKFLPNCYLSVQEKKPPSSLQQSGKTW